LTLFQSMFKFISTISVQLRGLLGHLNPFHLGVGIILLGGCLVLGTLGSLVYLHLWPDEPASQIVEQEPVPTGLPVLVTVARLPSLTPTITPIPSDTASPAWPSPTLHVPTVILEASFTPAQFTTIANLPSPTEAMPTPSPTPTEIGCPRPEGWTIYTVQEGDTLFAFQLGAGRAGQPATVSDMISANCLDSTFLTIGQVLWLPAGAAENAPSSAPSAPNLPAGLSRTPNCPCTITIHPGWRLEQIADEINRLPVAFTGADFLAYTRQGAPLPAREFLSSVPPNAGLEGFMFPGTYTLYNETSAEHFRDMVLSAFEANAAGVLNQAGTVGLSPYAALILASIIEKEAPIEGERPLVSSVFHNRINSDKGLGATVTLLYYIGRPGNWWPRPYQGITGLDTPYNTNKYRGLPPTAISNPSLSALQAAIQPAQTAYMYFTGNCHAPGNIFAVTYEEHLRNVNCEH
jgi:cell division protein YceG involved in septum cleavage